MGTIFDQNFKNIDSYVPGEQPDLPDMLKLNTNENPYPPAPGVIEALKEFNGESLRLYPAADAGALRRSIAAYHGVDPDRVFVGVGSDDVLANIFQSCFNSNKPVLFPDVTYSFYKVWAELYNVRYKTVPVREDFTVDTFKYTSTENGGIVIANPNAPTSIVLPLCDIEAIAAANPDRVVVIDEAYIDYGGQSALLLIDKYPNIVVVRTFSKSRALAGLRIGYAVSSPRIISTMQTVKNCINSYPMNRTAIEAGVASLKDEDYFRDRIESVVRTRGKMASCLNDLGFKVLPSSANFLFVTHPVIDVTVLFEELKRQHIFVRHFSDEKINEYLRITVGTDEQVVRLIQEMQGIIMCLKQ